MTGLQVGDLARIVKNPGYSYANTGDIVKILCVGSGPILSRAVSIKPVMVADNRFGLHPARYWIHSSSLEKIE